MASGGTIVFVLAILLIAAAVALRPDVPRTAATVLTGLASEPSNGGDGGLRMEKIVVAAVVVLAVGAYAYFSLRN